MTSRRRRPDKARAERPVPRPRSAEPADPPRDRRASWEAGEPTLLLPDEWPDGAPPPHLAKALRAAGNARALATRIRDEGAGLSRRGRVAAPGRMEVPSPPGWSVAAGQLPAPTPKASKARAVRPGDRPARPTPSSPANRFARTAAAAREILERDDGADSWHLKVPESAERVPWWQHLLRGATAGPQRVPFAVPGLLRRDDGADDTPRDARADDGVARIPSAPRLTGPDERARAPEASTARPDDDRFFDDLAAWYEAAPPATDEWHDRDLPRLAWSPAPESPPRAETAPMPSSHALVGSVDPRPRHSADRAASADDDGAAPAPLHDRDDRHGHAIVPWTRRRSSRWPTVVPPGFGNGAFGASARSAGRTFRSHLIHLVGLCVAVTGAFAIVHRDDLVRRATAVWSESYQSPATPEAEQSRPSAVAPPVVDQPSGPARDGAPETRVAALAEQERAVARGEAAPESPSGQGGPLSPDAAPPAVEWQVLYRLGHEFQSKGELEAAAEMFRLAAELNPSHGALLYDWGYLLQTQGEDEAAIAKYRRAIELDPAHPYAHYNLGYLLQRRGDAEAALDNYRQAGEIHPDNPYLQYNWGVVLEWLGDDEGAARRYRRSVELAPQSQPGLDARRRMAALDAAD